MSDKAKEPACCFANLIREMMIGNSERSIHLLFRIQSHGIERVGQFSTHPCPIQAKLFKPVVDIFDTN